MYAKQVQELSGIMTGVVLPSLLTGKQEANSCSNYDQLKVLQIIQLETVDKKEN